MKLKTMIVGMVLTLGLTMTGMAQESNVTPLVDGADVAKILHLARAHGQADLETGSNGNPKIRGTIDDITYMVYFMNCTDGQNCEDVNFYAGFSDIGPPLERLNEWNRDKRFGRAYLDEEGDAVIEMDLNLEYGLSEDNMGSYFGIWSVILDQYTSYIGYK